MRSLLRFLGIVAAVLVGLAILGGGLLAFEVGSRKPLKTVPSTTHASTNDRVGHYLPSGGNGLSVEFKAYDASGRMLKEELEGFGKDEALLLDFWSFNIDNRIASGEQREILFPLPEGRGTVEAVVRYHDWMRTKRIILTLEATYD